jgi:hypothetical protein
MKMKMKLAVVALALLAPAAARASEFQTQSFDLHPGWNAVYLEVAPQPGDTASVFQGIPIVSVWTWNPKSTPVDFIQDPSEAIFNRSGWLGYFPPGPSAVVNNLFTIEANRAYLVNLGGTSNATWTVTGRPSARGTSWVPNSFNLVGFHVDPAIHPAFSSFLASSPAHNGQPIYRLDTSGSWVQVPPATAIQSGEAYWVYCQGASTFTAPTSIELLGDGLNYGQSLTEQSLGIQNAGSAANVSLRLLASTDPVPLTYWQISPTTNQVSWPLLPSPLSVAAPAQGSVSLRLAVARASLVGDLGEGVLEVTDGRGTRLWVPVRAERLGAVVPASPSVRAARGAMAVSANPPSAPPYAGLWIGTVTVDKVSRSQYVITPSDPVDPTIPAVQGTSLTPIPVKSEFAFRVIVHIDASNTARLLKDVTQMWQNGTGGGAGHYVLVTDASVIPNFTGVALRDGDPVGKRASSAAIDFPASAPDYGLALSGSVSPPGTGTLSATFMIDRDFPTNPFKHKYHPDHDNLGPLGPVVDAFDVTRTISLDFASTDPTGANPPGYGSSVLGGSYSETFAAGSLHKNPIAVSGTFRLTRVSLTTQLNQ